MQRGARSEGVCMDFISVYERCKVHCANYMLLGNMAFTYGRYSEGGGKGLHATLNGTVHCIIRSR